MDSPTPDYLGQFYKWLLAIIFSEKTATLAGTLLIFYGNYMLGNLTLEQLYANVQAALLAWVGVTVLHGAARRTNLMR